MTSSNPITSVVDLVRMTSDDENDGIKLAEHLHRRRLIKKLMAITAAHGCSDEDIYRNLQLPHPKVRKLECGYDCDLTLANVQGYLNAAGMQIDLVETILHLVNEPSGISG